MVNCEELRKKIEDVLALLDGSGYPPICNYLSAIVYSDDDQLPPSIEIIGQLRRMEPLPQVIWDFIIELLEAEIEVGNDEAMNDLGAMYYAGTGCDQNFSKAVYYYKMAAEHGNRQAQENLGYCYYYGRNMPVDYEKAFHYFALGAFDGHLISLYKIGDMYAHGYYVTKNETEAFHIYERCLETMTEETAEVVGGPVYLRLGDMFLHGRGTKRDAETALICYQKAEVLLYNMVKHGDVMYRKSLHLAVDGQTKARERLTNKLPDHVWLDGRKD